MDWSWPSILFALYNKIMRGKGGGREKSRSDWGRDRVTVFERCSGGREMAG